MHVWHDIRTGPIFDLPTFIDLAFVLPTMFTSTTVQDTSIYQHLRATKGVLQDAVMPHLSHPTPFLEKLDLLCGHHEEPRVTSTIFDRDLSSLHEVRLEHVRTELPWRNMVNLTSFTLGYIPVGDFGQLLDFFESAPRFRDIELLYATLVPYGGNK